MRRTHILKENHRTATPTSRVYVDTEAHREVTAPGVERQTLWFGYACRVRTNGYRGKVNTQEDWLYFSDSDTFWKQLDAWSEPKRPMYIYAHNWDYDAALIEMATQSAKRGWEAREYIRSNHWLWAEFVKGDRKLVFIDSLNYFATSLANLGESIGVSKLQFPSDTSTDDEWRTYCKQDVGVLKEAIERFYLFIRENDLGNYQRTLAGQAMAAYKHRFNPARILILEDERISDLERQSYYGGRVEAFYRKEINQTVTCLDINSMFPFVMAENKYPIRKVRKGRSLSLAALSDILRYNCAVATVLIDTTVNAYPKRLDDILCWPVGRFWTTLCTPELQYALDRGDIVEIRDWVEYETVDLFSAYVHELYDIRQQYKAAGNDAFSYMTKIMLNSLYGKFGQRGFRWERCKQSYDDCPTEFYFDCQGTGRALKHRRRFQEVDHELQDSESFDSFPAISAHVTSYARMLLWRLLETAGPRNVYYCDTDSLFVTDAGLQALSGYVHPTALGALKVEGAKPFALFSAPKFYLWGEKRKAKGVRASARQIDPQTFEQEQFESYDRVLSRGEDGYITVRTIQKYNRLAYRKGVSQPDGWVTPFQLSEDGSPATLWTPGP